MRALKPPAEGRGWARVAESGALWPLRLLAVAIPHPMGPWANTDAAPAAADLNAAAAQGWRPAIALQDGSPTTIAAQRGCSAP